MKMQETRQAWFAGMAAMVAVLIGCGNNAPPPEMPAADETSGETAEPQATETEASVETEAIAETGTEVVEAEETAPPVEESVAAVEPEPAAEEEPAKPDLEGAIESKKGKVVVVAMSGAVPEVGAKGSLLKFFEKEIFGMKTTGWLDIAGVEVTKVAGQKAHMTILEVRSEMEVNGKKVDHFKKGNLVKFAAE